MFKFLLKNVKRQPIDFPTLKKPRRPNTYLVAPRGLTPFPPDAESPVYSCSADRLAMAVDESLLGLPGTQRLPPGDAAADSGGWQQDYVQYSRMGFPDTITVRCMDAGTGQSVIAIFSRAHYGVRDFGVNARRVGGIMAALAARFPARVKE